MATIQATQETVQLHETTHGWGKSYELECKRCHRQLWKSTGDPSVDVPAAWAAVRGHAC